VDIDGQTTPRYTTIYDAACQLDLEQPGSTLRESIPRLCHQPHMTPVAVCRLCVVRIYGTKRGKRTPERKLLPACQHPVKEGMEVFTMHDGGPDGKIVREAVTVLVELLVADNLKPLLVPELQAELEPFNELKQVAGRCGIEVSRFKSEFLNTAADQGSLEAPPARREPDRSSPVFVVDPSACILCDRCSRACNEVNKNNVIGRTGKGSTTAIGFDLDEPMGESSCVQCGECMISCPTSAIIFRRVKQVEIPHKKK
jgi:predicted molibdopterin-dependent oxidoreductase YjgC